MAVFHDLWGTASKDSVDNAAPVQLTAGPPVATPKGLPDGLEPASRVERLENAGSALWKGFT